MEEERNTSPVLRPARLPLAICRRKAGLTLKQIAATTKISPRFLRAIEAGEYEKLPGGIFTTSYLRQYADAIGFNEEELLAHYRSRPGTEPRPGQHSGEPRYQSRKKKWSVLDWFRVLSPQRFR